MSRLQDLVKTMPRFHEAVAALMAIVAIGVLSYAALFQNNQEALGALVGIAAAANGFFLRAKVVPPSQLESQ